MKLFSRRRANAPAEAAAPAKQQQAKSGFFARLTSKKQQQTDHDDPAPCDGELSFRLTALRTALPAADEPAPAQQPPPPSPAGIAAASILPASTLQPSGDAPSSTYELVTGADIGGMAGAGTASGGSATGTGSWASDGEQATDIVSLAPSQQRLLTVPSASSANLAALAAGMAPVDGAAAGTAAPADTREQASAGEAELCAAPRLPSGSFVGSSVTVPLELAGTEAPSTAPNTIIDVIAERAQGLMAAAHSAKAYRANCLALASFGASIVDVLRAREHYGLDDSSDEDRLSQVASLLTESTALAATCGEPGWMLLAASPEENVCEEMRQLHAAMLGVLKEQKADVVPGSFRLPPPSYPDTAKALNRRLKQMGSGSLGAGIELLAGSEEAQRQLGRELDVEEEDVRREATHLLTSGLVVGGSTSSAAAPDAVIGAARPFLEETFTAFATFGNRDSSAVEMDSFRFAKLVREAGLLGPGLTAQQLDVLFTQAKGRSARKLSFDGFLAALALIAEKRRLPLGQVVEAVAMVDPAAHATTPESVKWHDDFSTYTGVYKVGMSVTDKRLDLSRLVDRDAGDRAHRRASVASGQGATPPRSRAISGSVTPASGASTPRASSSGGPGAGAAGPRFSLPLPLHLLNSGNQGRNSPRLSSGSMSARGATTCSARPCNPASKRTPQSARGTPAASESAGQPVSSHPLTPSAFQEDIAATRFDMFSFFGRRSTAVGAEGEMLMDNLAFVRLCRDTGLMCKALTQTRVDLIFHSVVTRGARRMTFEQFMSGALPRLAEACGCTLEEVMRKILATSSRTHRGTTPARVRAADACVGSHRRASLLGRKE